MGILLLFVAPFILPSILPNPDDLYSSPERRDALRSFLDTLFMFCWLEALIAIYFFIVIYSQFKAMKEEEEEAAAENQRNTTAHDMPTINTIA